MKTDFPITAATVADAPEAAQLVGELLAEIMQAIGEPAFNFDLADTTARLAAFLAQQKSFVFLARDVAGQPAGVLTLYEGHALYAEGAFGTIAELYVRPDYRGHTLGLRLVEAAKALGRARGWTRLEVTTPPLPQFDRTLAFYQREGFAISCGRKLKTVL